MQAAAPCVAVVQASRVSWQLAQPMDELRVERHTEILRQVVSMAQKAGYSRVDYRVLNTADHGIPHSRRRVFIIGILHERQGRTFQWPEPLELPDGLLDIKSGFVDTSHKGSSTPTHKTFQENLNRAKAKAKSRGHKLTGLSPIYIVDAQASSTFANCSASISPCITASRGKAMGFWLPALKRSYTVKEMARLQGSWGWGMGSVGGRLLKLCVAACACAL